MLERLILTFVRTQCVRASSAAKRLGLLAIAFTLFAAPLTIAFADGLSPGEQFFEGQVRPLLVEHCQECHGVELQESDLRLDSIDTILQGGISGPAAIANDIQSSLIIDAVLGRRGVEQMPPDEPLNEKEIRILKQWINRGLPWTRSDTLPTSDSGVPALGDQEAIGRVAQEHWAFQPISRPQIPKLIVPRLAAEQGEEEHEPHDASRVTGEDYPRNEIDRFIEAKQRSLGLSRSDVADRATILRRLCIDLVGLPPTYDQMRKFVDDPRSTDLVVAETINRLLGSDHYGERWARYWLDLARYADTRDWLAQAELRYPYAYTYRDYVIDSFNNDKPYDQFIREQLAADLLLQSSSDELESPQNAPELAALGMLTVGPRFRNSNVEQIADKIDVIGRGLMGITISCARCHDHKYDPIPIEDYYSLYGVFASCKLPDDFPEIPSVNEIPDDLTADFQRQLAKKQKVLADYKAKLRKDAIVDLKEKLPKYLEGFYLMSISKSKSIRGVIDQLDLKETAMTPLDRVLAARLKTKRDAEDPILSPWHLALSASEVQYKQNHKKWINQWQTDSSISPAVSQHLAATMPETRREFAHAYGELFSQILSSRSAAEDNDSNDDIDPDTKRVIDLLTPGSGWLAFDDEAVAQASRLLGKGRKALGDREKAITEVEASHPGSPPRAMTLIDTKRPVTPFVFLRGEPKRRGDRVPRQFISVLAGDDRKPFKQGSGRLELAEAITAPDNPLTTRVIVNRVWAKYFGRGLVQSQDDFGLRCEPPSHPELLDYLATEFMDNGYSLKWLHKTITTSRAYAQSSNHRDDAFAADPENTYLWRQNRKRLDFEAMRDSVIAVAGTLDDQVGGRSVRLSDTPYSTRRSLYAYVDRVELDPILRTFDFASPTASSAERAETTIPQQALFFMNHPFVAQQARKIASRTQQSANVDINSSKHDSNATTGGEIQQLYQTIFARTPSPAEHEVASEFLDQSASDDSISSTAIWSYGFGPAKLAPGQSSLSPEAFEPLSHWTGKAYQFSNEYPHPTMKHAKLFAAGGDVGSDEDHSVIRRWTAPNDGAIRVAGTLRHSREGGDGVQGIIRAGDIREVFHVARSETKPKSPRIDVKRGEVVDFIVSPGPKSNTNSDSFTWQIAVIGVDGDLAGTIWRSQPEFASPPPPPLSPLAQLAQALLLSNEFLYVD